MSRVCYPNSDEFPDFDDNLRQSFQRETELFFESILREDRNVIDLLTADYTFLNERLARHYGIPDIYGSRFRRVTLTGDERRGLLGQGSILAVTSHSDRTSPVVRGKWILENILGMPVPPPPPDVPLAQGESGGREAADHARADGGASRQSEPARPATRRWTRSASRSKISTRWARGGRDERRRADRRFGRARGRHEGRWCRGAAAGAGEPPGRICRDADGEAADVCARAGDWTIAICRRFGRLCAMRRATIIGFRR